MKRRGILLILLLLGSFLLVSAADNESVIDVSNLDEESAKVEAAYDCLENKIDDCSDLSLEEQIFSLLALGKCRSEVTSQGDECWPEDSCNIKTTSQAIVALSKTGSSTSDAVDWLLTKNQTPKDFIWYLQIDSNEETRCDISGRTITIKEDKTISGGAGSCFSVSSNGYWLKISSSCYDKEFEISCEEDFSTNLLYQLKDSSTIHVSEQTNSAPAEGTTKEKISLYCFTKSGECDYESSLWATYALSAVGEEVEPFLPYLMTFADKNTKYISYSFLYDLTKNYDYKTDLISLKKSNYWDESGDKVYDTALALMSLYYDDSLEKESAKNWLLEIQDKEGCWKGNIRNTAFVLNSVWPKQTNPYTDQGDCEEEGYFCLSNAACSEAAGAEIDFHCFYPKICCSKNIAYETCEEKGGDICNSFETCSGQTSSADDVESGQTCCVSGVCEQTIAQSDCEANGGICRYGDCSTGEETASDSCSFSSEICCVQEEGSSYWWIWILLILILLVILGIIFRKKIQPFFGGIMSKIKPDNNPKFPPRQRMMPRTILPKRTIIPPSQIPRRQSAPASRPVKEIDDVLKKLKEMGK